MKYALFYKQSAAEELLQLPVSIALKIKEAINHLTENPRPQNCIKLKGAKNDYRIRIGNYRVVYTILDAVLMITIIKIAHRKDIYR